MLKKTFLSIIFSLTLWAVPSDAITIEKAEALAARLLGTDALFVARQDSAFCVFTPADSVGFAVIAMHPRSGDREVLAFSRDGRWDDSQLPPPVSLWLQRAGRTLSVHIGTRQIDDKHDKQKDTAVVIITREDVEPLLTCHWHQRSPYNDLSPIITDGQIKSVAGCVAIAAAQITYYWRRDNPPSTLKDTPTYNYSTAPVTMSIPKGTANNWELMLDSYSGVTDSAARAAAAQLCYVLGTTSYLNYASSTSGNINTAASAMYSQYRLLSSYASKNKYTQQEWVDLLYSDLVKEYPVLCSGDGPSGGHAFVLDGYDSGTNLFHFNFGWGGTADGYYPLDGSEDDMGGFYQNQSVIYNIHPSDGDTTTGIEEQMSSVYETPIIYTLWGKRVEKPAGKGIYIYDYGTERKKVLVR